MKLRTTCKCGAEFEVRGRAWRQTWTRWLALHMRCLGIESFDTGPDGNQKVVWLREDDE